MRDAFSATWWRQLLGIRDTGEATIATAGDADGGAPTDIDDDKTSVWVKIQDTLSGFPFVGRLFAPGNMVWRLPRKDDPCIRQRPSDAGGPGTGAVLHGFGGPKDSVPDWLDETRSGLSVPEVLRIESTGDAVEIKSNRKGTVALITLAKDGSVQVTATSGKNVTVDVSGGGKVLLAGGGVAVVRNNDVVNINAALTTLLTNILAALSGLGAPVAPLAGTAIGTVQASTVNTESG